MIAPPHPADEGRRLAALRSYEILDTPPEPAFDRITRLAASVLDTPISVVSLVDDQRQWFKSCIGLDVSETGRDVSFCGHAILDDGVTVVPDAARDQRFAGNPAVVGHPHIRFYAGAPLVTWSGWTLGTLCVADVRPRDDFTDRDRETLTTLASVVIDELELRRVTGELLEAHRELTVAQDRLERATATARVGLWEVDLDTNDVWWSRETHHLLGIPESTANKRSEFFARLRDADRVSLRDRFRRAAEDGREVTVEHVLSDTDDGAQRWLRWTARAVDLPGGRRAMHGTVEDSTAPREWSSALASVQLRADQANQVRLEFLSRASHELRTPLTTISGFAQLLSTTDVGEAHPSELAEIQHATNQLRVVVEQLLDLQRLELGQLAAQLAAVDLDDLRRSVLLACRETLDAKDLALRLSGEAPAARADARMLQDAVVELIENAVNHSPRGVEIELRLRAVAGARIRIEILDRGPGIPVEHADRVFRPFTKLEGTPGKGAGLGLALVRGLVSLMDGSVGVAHPPHGGACVWIELPTASSQRTLNLRANEEDVELSPRSGQR